MTPADVAGLKEGMQRYGLLLSEAGTIKDDFMFSRLRGEAALYLVVNAGTKEGDFAYIGEKLKGAAALSRNVPTARFWRCRDRWRPRCWSVTAPGISSLTFMRLVRATVAGAPAIISRTGYTGEDGFEISLEGADAERVARALLGESRGAAHRAWRARQSAGWKRACAFTAMTWTRRADPVEANLLWSIGKRRKEAQGFSRRGP